MEEDNKELQDEEIMALEAIYGPESIKQDPSTPRGYHFTLNLDYDDDECRSPRILVLRFFLPDTYPKEDPPVYEISSVYCGTHKVDATMLDAIDHEFSQLFQPGQVVLFEWITWLRDYLEATVQKNDLIDSIADQQQQQLASSQIRVPDDETEHQATPPSPPPPPPPQESIKVPEIYSSPEPLVDRKSVFIAHVAEVHSAAEVKAVISKLLENKKIARATHNISAYRIELSDGRILQDNDDDGETAAGGRLLHLLQILDVQNVLVVVSRWYGGIQLGADRFKDINNCARKALEDRGYIHDTEKSNKSKRKK